jgi:aminopeptidase N
LTAIPGDAREKALANFGERYRDEPLVLDKWFTLQATIEEPETLARIETLLNHPAFALSNPNRVRSLVGSFAMANQTQFNRADGAGYRFIAATILRVDRLNPQLAARLMTAFSSWRMMESGRRSHAEQALQSISETAGLSRDASDIVHRTLQ